MKPLLIILLLAIAAFAQNARVLPKDTEIKVRTDVPIPAKPASGAAYAASAKMSPTAQARL